MATVLSVVASRAATTSPVRWIQQLAGSGTSTVAGMATDANGNIYLAGTTTSVDLPVKSAFQSRPGSAALLRIDAPGAWTNLYQPGAISVSVVRAAPSSPGTLYAVATSGLLRTTDNGATWNAIGSFDASLNDIAIGPSNGNILYLASAAGVFRSTDVGATFQPVNNGIPLAGADTRPYAFSVWIDPVNSSVVYASTATGLVRSADGGDSWRQVFTHRLSSLAFDPFTRGILYLAGTESPAQISLDDGLTWNAAGQGPFQPTAVVPDPRRLGVLYGRPAYGSALMVSSDRGATWRSTGAPFPGIIGLMAADPATGAIYVDIALSPEPLASVSFFPNAQPRGDRILMSGDGFQSTTAVGPPTLAPVASLAVSSTGLFVGTKASPDIYVAKFDALGNILNLTYFGGSGIDQATAMTADSSGAVYVTGTTTSMDLPVTPGAYAATGQTFVFKLNPDGSLAWSTYFTDSDSTPVAIAVNSSGHVFVAGQSFNDLPVTPGAYQATSHATVFCAFPIGCVSATPNGFVTGFDSSGSSLILSTYFGQSVSAVAASADGSPIIADSTALYKLSPEGTTLRATSKALGITAALYAAADGTVFATGSVPMGAAFPATPGAFQTAAVAVPSLPGGFGGSGPSAFLARLDSDLNVTAGTLFGGESGTFAQSVALGPDGSVLIGGFTTSKGLPLHNTIWGPFSQQTGFVAKFTSDLSSLLFSTFAGDTRGFQVRSVSYGPEGSILFAGFTSGASPGVFLDALAPGQNTPRLDTVVNAATRLASAVSPGETIEVRGSGFANDTSLLLNGSPVAAAILDSTRLTATVPADLNALALLEIRSGGQTSNSLLLPVAAVSPGIFSVDGSGDGQGYILNQDGTLNSPDNPAAEGSPITICATGVGSLSFVGPYAVTDTPVNVFVDGFYADGIAAKLSPVPGLPGDVYQIGVYVPHPADHADQNPNLKGFVMPPRVSIWMDLNGTRSRAGVALSVKPK